MYIAFHSATMLMLGPSTFLEDEDEDEMWLDFISSPESKAYRRASSIYVSMLLRPSLSSSSSSSLSFTMFKPLLL